MLAVQLLRPRLTTNSWISSCVAAVFRRATVQLFSPWTIRTSRLSVAACAFDVHFFLNLRDFQAALP